MSCRSEIVWVKSKSSGKSDDRREFFLSFFFKNNFFLVIPQSKRTLVRWIPGKVVVTRIYDHHCTLV